MPPVISLLDLMDYWRGGGVINQNQIAGNSRKTYRLFTMVNPYPINLYMFSEDDPVLELVTHNLLPKFLIWNLNLFNVVDNTIHTEGVLS